MVRHIEGNDGFVNKKKKVVEGVARSVDRKQVCFHCLSLCVAFKTSLLVDFDDSEVRMFLRRNINFVLAFILSFFSKKMLI